MSRFGDYFSALSEPEFRKLYLGQAVSIVGTMLSYVALPFAVLSIGGTATDIGIVEACNLVSLAVVVLAGGVWADRLSRRRVMISMDFVRMVLQLVTAAVLLTGVAQIWMLAALQVGIGAAEGFFRPAYMGLMPQIVSARHLQQANALSALVNSFAITVGSVIGGVLVAAIGAGWAIGIDSLSYLASALFLLRLLPTPAGAAGAERQSFVTDLRAGAREFFSHSWLWAMVLGVSVMLFIVEAPLNVLGPVIAQEVYRGARTWGLVIAALGVGQIIGGAVALRWRPSRPMLIIGAGLALTGVPGLLLIVGASEWMIMAGMVVLGVEWGLFDPFWITAMQQHVAPELISRVSSYDYMGSLAFYPFGLAVAGPLAAWLGVDTVLWIGVASAIGLAVFLVSLPGVRGLRQVKTGSEPG
jgi:MFS family permease